MSAAQREFDVAVLGGGPGGAAAAVALARAGVRVLLVARPAEEGCEGLSERAVGLLREHGLPQAAALLDAPLPRYAHWAGQQAAKGAEYLVSRAELHAALARDAGAAEVTVLAGSAAAPTRTPTGWLLPLGGQRLAARFIVDARGRRVARAPARGPRLLSLFARCPELRGVEPGSRVVALPSGWCWAIALPDGGGAIQFVGAPRPAQETPGARLRAAVAGSAALRPWLQALDSAAPVLARAATAQRATVGDCELHAPCGDALVALDPLSGQGVYEALAAVPMTVATARGALAGDDPALRARFVAERALAIWQRTVRVAGEFYRAQADDCGTEFWRHAAAEYEALASAATSSPVAVPHVAWRPVLDGTRIAAARVVVTSAQPRGAWQVEGVTLATLLDALGEEPRADVATLAARCGHPAAAVGRALGWLRQQGMDGILVEGRDVAQVAAAGAGGGTS